MSRLAFLLVFLLGTQLFGQEDAKEAAEKSATAWLALVDSGSYAESWDQAADVLKSAVTKQDWETKIKSVREQTGKLTSRKLQNAQYTETLPGAPAGKYVVLQYDSVFASGSFIETAIPMQEKDGTWKISGYFIKPAQ